MRLGAPTSGRREPPGRAEPQRSAMRLSTLETHPGDGRQPHFRLEVGHCRLAERPAVAEAAEGEKLRICLDRLAELLQTCGQDLQAMLRGSVEILPSASRFPDRCWARLVVNGACYATQNYRESPSTLVAEVIVRQEAAGWIEMGYLEPCPEAEHGPFTESERSLLHFMAALLSKTIERLRIDQQLRETVQQLQGDRASLEQANAALKSFFDNLEDERNQLRRSIAASVDKVVMPLVRTLEAQSQPADKPLVGLLRRSLEEIASPFADKLSRAFASLTPLEIGICRMIRDNLSTKEIAKIRHVAPATVARQREQIRRKLGITGSDANLATFLRAYME